MSLIKRVNTLNDTIRRKRTVVGTNQNGIDNNNNNSQIKTKALSSASLSSIIVQVPQPQQLQRPLNNLQHQSLSPQQFHNVRDEIRIK